MGTSPGALVDRFRVFFVEDLWREDLGAGGPMALLVRGLQLLTVTVRGFIEDNLLLRASALAFMTSLAIIPVLVVVLSIIKWLGLSRDLVVVGVNQFLAGSPDAVDRIMEFVDRAQVGALGSAGGAVFLVTTVLSLRHVEETFNDVWGALQRRSWVRRFTNYLAVLVVVPLAAGALVSFSSAPAGSLLRQRLYLDSFAGVALGLAPAAFLFVAFFLAYLLLPNTKVRIVSALLGGAVAAGLFIGAQYLYVTFSIGAARYDALFGGFAFLPLMLVWIYVSWAIVLLGVEIVYSHQHLKRHRREARERGMQPAEREAVGMRLAVEIARAFRDGRPPQTGEELGERLGSSLRVVSDLLVRLQEAAIINISGGEEGETAYQLARPAERIEVGAVLEAIRGHRDDTTTRSADGEVRGTLQRVDRVLGELDGAMHDVSCRTLADLLEGLPADAV